MTQGFLIGRTVIWGADLVFQVPVGSWFDDMSDTELRDLMPFFDKLSRVEDVYTVLRNSNNAAGGGGGGSPAFPAPLLMNGSAAALHSSGS
ncbi:hypothetical protein HPB52_001807 [Rhipicephalus sanguineus]|uniref:Uncharacterized protein n=1 Tax=Rhipicephalus sanguineus TaxID=34632 RepID=A0A9D4QI20_RHISA|nr:hypothetical protein HPB52_001807 [Rhipicephalus sanguineus]